MPRAGVLGCKFCKREVEAKAERVPTSRGTRLWEIVGPERRLAGSLGMLNAVDFDCEKCKSDCEDGAKIGLVSKREGLLGGSQAREGVWGLPGVSPEIGYVYSK